MDETLHIERPDTPAPVSGFGEGLVLIPDDGSVIIYTPGSGQVETLFGPNNLSDAERRRA